MVERQWSYEKESFSPENTLAILKSIENWCDWTLIQNLLQHINILDTEQKIALLKHIDFLLVEWDPSYHPFLRRLKQALLGSAWSHPSGEFDLFIIWIWIKIQKNWVEFDVRYIKNKNFLALMKCNIPYDYDESISYDLWISNKDNSIYTNIKVFFTKINGVEKRYVYIADRYVSINDRGKGYWKILLQIVDDIASKVNADEIIWVLIPEDSENMDKLKQWHINYWYDIEEINNRTITRKKPSK